MSIASKCKSMHPSLEQQLISNVAGSIFLFDGKKDGRSFSTEKLYNIHSYGACLQTTTSTNLRSTSIQFIRASQMQSADGQVYLEMLNDVQLVENISQRRTSHNELVCVVNFQLCIFSVGIRLQARSDQRAIYVLN